MTDRAHVLWIFTAVALVLALLVILSLVRRRRLRGKYGLFWLIVVAGFLPFAIEPDLVDALGDRLGVRYQPAMLIIAGLGVLTLLAMHFSWEVSRLEERSRAMAEELALLRARVEESAALALPANLATDDRESVVPCQEGGDPATLATDDRESVVSCQDPGGGGGGGGGGSEGWSEGEGEGEGGVTLG